MKNINDQIVIYQTEDGNTAIDVRLENETVWLSQAQMSQLFKKDRTVIARHIANVYKEGELVTVGTHMCKICTYGCRR